MTAPSRLPDIRHDEVPRELIELGKRISQLPDGHYAGLTEPFVQAVECVKRRKRILSLVQEALSQLRLDIKYLMFDLEVTRKERDELRRQLDELRTDESGNGW